MDFLWPALLQIDFLPHGWCYRWVPGLVWLHVVSDLLVALAYYSIPFSLVYIVRRRGDLVYPWMFWLFGAFILACGTTHLFSILVVWKPWYWADGIIKLLTAGASVPTAICLLLVAPAIVALPSPEQLRILNRQLQTEVADRKTAEMEVRHLNATLEQRVQERTQELERVNQQLRESENRLRAILDNAPAVVYMKDPAGKYLFVNRLFEHKTGKLRQDMMGKSDLDLFPLEAAASYQANDQIVFEKEEPVEVEEYAVQDSETRTYTSTKFPLKDERGAVYAMCALSSDITERKRAEIELRRYTSDLEQFAFVVAHDLQEPLRTVKSYAQLVSKRYKGKLDSDADDFLEFITSGVDRMQELISGLQTYSDLNRREIKQDIADCEAVLRNTLRNMETTILSAGAEVEHDPLPWVRAHPTKVGQLFQNLIGNAIKYRSPGVPPRIRITAAPRNSDWEFVVTDNGIGFEMQYAEQIFGVFKRLHGRDVPGTGIGLAICKRVVESYGGRIWAVSSPGAGAEFHFTLPRAV